MREHIDVVVRTCTLSVPESQMFRPFLLKARKRFSKPRDQDNACKGDTSLVGCAGLAFSFHPAIVQCQNGAANCTLVVGNPAFAADDAADDVVAFVGAVENGLRLFHLFGGDDDDEADAHVEGAEHLVLGYVA